MSKDANPAPTPATLRVRRSLHDPERYDIWVSVHDGDRRQVVLTVAALLGLDHRHVQKIVDSESPIRRGIKADEVRYLRDRFSDFGLGIRVAPERLVPVHPFVERLEAAAAQCLVGVGIGIIAAVLYFLSSFAWPGLLITLACSTSIGLFWGFTRPTMNLKSALACAGVVALLFYVELDVTPRIAQALDQGRSSNFDDLAGAFLFVMLCTTIAAPLAGLTTQNGKPHEDGRPRID